MNERPQSPETATVVGLGANCREARMDAGPLPFGELFRERKYIRSDLRLVERAIRGARFADPGGNVVAGKLRGLRQGFGRAQLARSRGQPLEVSGSVQS